MLVKILLFIFVQLCAFCLQEHQDSPSLQQLMSLYRTNQVLNNVAKQLSNKYSKISQVRTCKQDSQYKYLHIGNKKRSTFIIICNIHARELISSQICIEWAQRYLQRKDAGKVGIDVIYNANKNRDTVIRDRVCARKNAQGLDLNRNFPVQYNFYKVSPQNQIYSGTSPISDPFTQCLWQIINKNQTLLFVDIHSGQNGGLFYQQGYNSVQDRQIFIKLNKQVCNNTCRITTLAQDGQAINGHIFASVKVLKDIKYSLLIQSYGSGRGPCLIKFNPSSIQQRNKTVQKWIAGLNLITDQVKKRQGL